MSQKSQPRLISQLRHAVRVRHYSIRTEESYVQWVKRFIRFNGLRHPRELAAADVGRFLTWLAVERKVSASTQDQALSALVFLYRNVLSQPLGLVDGVSRAKRPKNLPVVLSQREVLHILQQLDGVPWLMVSLLYGSGLRLMECVRLRVKDIDFEYRCLTVRRGKGGKDRVVTLADGLIPHLHAHLNVVRIEFEREVARGVADVWLPHALGRKFPMQVQSGAGSTCSRLVVVAWIRGPARSVATMSGNETCRRRCESRYVVPVYTRR